MSWRSALDRLWYPGVEDHYDLKIFREEVLLHLTPGAVALDLGAGRGAESLLNFKGFAEIWGADIDPVVLTNPHLDRAFVTSVDRLDGVPDASVDLVFCCSVVEHLEQPAQLMTEIRRVLKPGGRFIAKTPNRLHYMPAIASITPLWFHKLYNRWRGRKEEDTFPTVYRMNTPAKIRAIAAEAGLAVQQIWTYESRPEYLRLTPITYLAGWVYERTVNRLNLDRFKCVLFMVLRRAA